jgi:hypothetical protein
MHYSGLPKYSGKFLGVYFNSNSTSETGNSQSVTMIQSEDGINYQARPSSMQPTSAGVMYRDFCPTYDPVTNALYSSSTQGSTATYVPIFQCVDGRQWTYNGAGYSKPNNISWWATEFVRYQNGSMWKDANGLPRLIYASGNSASYAFVIYTIKPVDTTWPTGGAWNSPVALTWATAPSDLIDPSVVYGSDNNFHLVGATRTAAGPGNSTIQHATSTSIDGTFTLTTGSTTAADPFNLGSTWEGPQILYRPKTNDYILYVDKQGLNYYYTTSSTIAGFNATTTPLKKLGLLQHGNTVPLPPGWDY